MQPLGRERESPKQPRERNNDDDDDEERRGAMPAVVNRMTAVISPAPI
jgi:hypothetical protein